MRYGSLCSGIEAASVAWEPLGWQPAWFAEIEPFPSAVLSHHWPHVPNHGDMTLLVGKILSGAVEAPDILVGGTPCQAFSVAGLRGSLDDERGNLTLTLIRILDAIDFIRARNGQPPCIPRLGKRAGRTQHQRQRLRLFFGRIGRGKRGTQTGRAKMDERRLCAWTQTPHRVAHP